MRTTKRRTLTLLDLFALIAATAVGIALVLGAYEVCDVLLDPGGGEFYLLEDRVGRCCVWSTVATPLIAAWTMGLLVLRLVPPRPTLRRMFRQPGSVALFGASSSICLLAVLRIGTNLLRAYQFGMDVDKSLFIIKMKMSILTPLGLAGLVVTVAWIVQWLGGRWRAEPDWIDRAGRVLGVIWIALLPLSLYTLIVAEGF